MDCIAAARVRTQRARTGVSSYSLSLSFKLHLSESNARMEQQQQALRCVACQSALSFERDVIVAWGNRGCATHARLSAHYSCYRAAAQAPTCKCVEAQKTRTRFPINHGDSLKCAPMWIDAVAM